MTEDESTAYLHLQEIAEYGTDTRRGNLLGVQPFMVPVDYASEERFYARMDGFLAVARQRGWLNEKTIVVFPEYIGTWLVAAGEKPRVYQAESIARAMQTLVLSHPLSFVRVLPFAFARAKDAVKYSLFRMKAARMAEIYHAVFSGLAKKHGVTIVAGSIVLPSPEIRDGKLEIGDGELYNVSVVYRPDGAPYEDVVRKVFPIGTELPFTTQASAADLPVFDTPAGRVGVLICADSWYPSPYEVMQAKGADLAAVPSYLAPDGIWDTPWRGYDGAPAPDDVDARDVNKISEGEAWLKYALAGRMAGAGIQHGINVFLRGGVWDLGSDGHTVVVRERTVVEAKHVAGAAIINSWL
jgi:predicted amidohydrolase